MALSRTRSIGLLAVLALAPVTYYTLGTGQLIVWASLVCVVLITASLFWMFGPAEETAAGH